MPQGNLRKQIVFTIPLTIGGSGEGGREGGRERNGRGL